MQLKGVWSHSRGCAIDYWRIAKSKSISYFNKRVVGTGRISKGGTLVQCQRVAFDFHTILHSCLNAVFQASRPKQFAV